MKPKIVLWILVSIILTIIYYSGATFHANKVNINIDEGDQIEYIFFAKKAKSTNYEYMGGRNRMPLYPFFQSWTNDANLNHGQYFLKAKKINILLSIVLLWIIYFVLWRSLGFGLATLLTLITAFSVFIFKAGYVQPELLFYFLNFLVFIGFISLFQKPTIFKSICVGISLGIAHLTKASITPALAIFIIIFAAQHLVSTKNIRLAIKHICVLLLCFFIIIGPYISQNKKIYGHYFYNVSTNFEMLSDSLEEYQKGPRAHGDRQGWPDMNNEDIPSMRKYFSEHSVFDVIYRLLKYGKGVLKSCMNSYGYQYFVIVYLIWFFLNLRFKGALFKELILKHIWPVAFVSSYFSLYFLLYAWYGPIELGNRLILAQILPLCYILSRCIQLLSWRINQLYAVQAALFLVLAYPMVQWLLTTYAGS